MNLLKTIYKILLSNALKESPKLVIDAEANHGYLAIYYAKKVEANIALNFGVTNIQIQEELICNKNTNPNSLKQVQFLLPLIISQKMKKPF